MLRVPAMYKNRGFNKTHSPATPYPHPSPPQSLGLMTLLRSSFRKLERRGKFWAE